MNTHFCLRSALVCSLLVACSGPDDEGSAAERVGAAKTFAAPGDKRTDDDGSFFGDGSEPERDQPADAPPSSDDLPAQSSEAPADDPTAQPDRVKSDPTRWRHDGLPPAPAYRPFDIASDQPLFAALLDGGSEGAAYATCVSKAPGQTTIVSDVALPVGNGRYLECATIGAPSTSVAVDVSDDGTPYCVTGMAIGYQGAGDRRLHVDVTSTPLHGSWTFTATSEQAFELHPVQTQDGAVMWPIWIYVDYQHVGLDPYIEGADPYCPGAA